MAEQTIAINLCTDFNNEIGRTAALETVAEIICQTVDLDPVDAIVALLGAATMVAIRHAKNPKEVKADLRASISDAIALAQRAIAAVDIEVHQLPDAGEIH